MSFSSTHLRDNLQRVRERIAAAAERSGRTADQVRLVGVTKYVSVDVAARLAEAGCLDLGESRPQELWRKADAITSPPVRWHLVGHLQRNKVRRTLRYAPLIHSGDSLRLLAEINRVAGELEQRARVLLEVNISADESKHGFAPHELAPLLPELAGMPHLDIRGLMAMAALDGDLTTARRNFAALRELRASLRAQCPPELVLDELSMGMSRDYETAIEEGATIVRIGKALVSGPAE